MSIKNIRLLLTDVDGILTDGKVYLDNRGGEFTSFDIQDGIGQRLAAAGGLQVGWLSGRTSKPVALRAKRLDVPFLFRGKVDKVAVARKLCAKLGLSLSQVAYLGDDLIDLPLLRKAGWSATVPYGRPEVRKAVHYVTRAPGGGGAFREVVEKILKARGLWGKALGLFHNGNGHSAWSFPKGLD